MVGKFAGARRTVAATAPKKKPFSMRHMTLGISAIKGLFLPNVRITDGPISSNNPERDGLA
jgi:hypothetical protein